MSCWAANIASKPESIESLRERARIELSCNPTITVYDGNGRNVRPANTFGRLQRFLDSIMEAFGELSQAAAQLDLSTFMTALAGLDVGSGTDDAP